MGCRWERRWYHGPICTAGGCFQHRRLDLFQRSLDSRLFRCLPIPVDFPPAVHTEFCQYLLSLCNLLDEWWGGLSHYTFKRLEFIAYSTLLAPRIGGRHWGCFLCHARARRQGSRTLDEKTGRNSPRAVSAGGLYVNYIMGLVMGGVVPFAQHTLA